VGVTEARKTSITGSGLEDWDADQDPANVPHPILHQHVEHQTDNWDDDFEDGRDSPKKIVNTSPRRRREESWDDDMDLGEESEDSAEFGFAEKEDDRTVTAKSRRAALKRLSSPSNSAPPMPPPLPADFLPNIYQQRAQGGPYRTFQQPFPARSPTTSVFSVPTTIQTHYSSTTHLRPTSAFALLPPSPPIHKERERKRLRKKSRPKPKGTFELASLRGSSMSASETHLGRTRPSDFNGNRDSLSDGGDAEPSTFEPPRQTPVDTSEADDRREVTAPSLPQTPAKGSALLSRIGSVKKWGVRRKRASTTPSEVIGLCICIQSP
jgi:serine/arginine repetitive matrix protein 2